MLWITSTLLCMPGNTCAHPDAGWHFVSSKLDLEQKLMFGLYAIQPASLTAKAGQGVPPPQGHTCGAELCCCCCVLVHAKRGVRVSICSRVGS